MLLCHQHLGAETRTIQQGEALRKDHSRLGHQMARGIIDILKANGIEVPEEKTEALEKDVVKDYKSVAIVTDLQSKLASAETERDQYKGIAETFEGEKPEDIAKLKSDFEALKKAAEDREKQDEASNSRKAFEADFDRALGERKFSNNLIRKSVLAEVMAAREKDQASGISDLIDQVTKDQTGVFANPQKETPKELPTPSDGQSSKKTYTKEDIDKMTPEEINKNWADVQASLPTISKE